MTEGIVRTDLVSQLFRDVLPAKFDGPKARVMLHAIALQESRYTYRKQIGGPARGFWQFERGGGVTGVLAHASTAHWARAVCAVLRVAPTPAEVHPRLAEDDLLAAAFARLLLWTDPRALPIVGDVNGAWDVYIRNWRPGKPHRETWDRLYAQAKAAVL